MRKVIPYIFFMSWLLSACSVDQMLDDWRVGWTAVVALIVVMACAIAMSGDEE